MACTWSGGRLLDAVGRPSIVPYSNAQVVVWYTGPHCRVDRIRGRELAPEIFGRGTGAGRLIPGNRGLARETLLFEIRPSCGAGSVDRDLW